MTDVSEVAPSVVARRRRWPRVVLACAVVVVLVVAGLVWYLTSRPEPLHLFGGHGNEVGIDTMRIGRAYYQDTWIVAGSNESDTGDDVDDDPVTIDSVEPVVVTNTAGARIGVFLGRERPGDALIGGPLSEMARYWILVPFVPGTYRISENTGGRAILLAVTLSRPGRVVIAGVRVRYHRGDRTGDEQTGVDMDFSTAARG